MIALIGDTLFYQWIKNIPAIQAIVGDRIFPSYPEQDCDYPIIVYSMSGYQAPAKTLQSNLGANSNESKRPSIVTLEVLLEGDDKPTLDNLLIAFGSHVHNKSSGSIRLARIGNVSESGDIDGMNKVLEVNLFVWED